jgi:hypothetical protein
MSFESKVLRRIFGSKREDITAGWRKTTARTVE